MMNEYFGMDEPFSFLPPEIPQKNKSDKRLYIAAIVLSALYMLEFFGTGVLIFANMYYTFAAMPFILSAIAILPLLFSILNVTVFKKKMLSVGMICAAVVMAIGHFLFTAFVLSKLTYILITGLPYYIVAGLVGLFLFLILAYPKFNKLGKKLTVIILSAAIFFISVFGVLKLTVFSYTSDGVVFAVEDEYQIAWSTSVKSTGYITIGDYTFYDEEGGSNNVSTLHKITVPMELLDEVKSYTLHSTPVYSEAAYLSVSGKERTRTYTFRPVDTTDGLQIYNISDSHECLSGPSAAAGYFGDTLDLLVLNGDIINDVSSEWQISLIYKLASRITAGTRPVIFVRGNHECNGSLASSLADYVGSRDGTFYYTVQFDDVFMLILDTNNDMSDDNFLISPQANFELVRQQETEWLNSLEYFGEDCEYKLLFSHMAFALSDYTRFPEWTAELIEATDGKFDLCISGHSHKLDYAEAGTGTNTTYPVLRGSIRSNNRTSGEGVSPAAFTGAAIECKDGHITAWFTNSKGEVRSEISIK